MNIILLPIILIALALGLAFWKELLKFAIGAGVLGAVLYFVVKQHG
jgi:hypothetical protein